ncbi:hypothetical protein BC835DRAFT_1460405 [Cytidiella melzeri]|nr:hypothetical protein BC835DRAFT_1460405 [Cytidiella melzeri]
MAPQQRYNLRRRANSVPESPATVPGAFVTPVQSLQALLSGASPLSPIPSMSPEATSTPDTKPLYSAVVSRSPSRSSTYDASPSGLSNIFPSLSIKADKKTAIEDVSDNEELPHITVSSGPAESLWTEVRYHSKRARANSPGAQQDSTQAALTDEQCHAIATAASRMSAAEQKTYDDRMSKVTVAKKSTHERSRSREEGPSKQQGKTIDPRSWGGIYLDPAEMDPDEQRKALELWNGRRALSKSQQTLNNEHSPAAETDRGSLSAKRVRDENSEVLERLETLMKDVASLKQAGQTASPTPLENGDIPAHQVATFSGVTLRKPKRAAVASNSPKVHGENLRPVNQVEPTSYLGKAFASIPREDEGLTVNEDTLSDSESSTTMLSSIVPHGPGQYGKELAA